MNLILLEPDEQHGADILGAPLMRVMQNNNLVRCRSLDDFFGQLRSQRNRPQLAVLCIGDELVLKSLIVQRVLLADVALVLLLPNQDAELLELAHRLRPRYIEFWGSGIERLIAVLKNMIPKAAERA